MNYQRKIGDYTFRGNDGTDNPHRLTSDFSERAYYAGGSACGCNDELCTRIELTPKHGTYPELTFEIPRQQHELGKVERMMASAYERGKADRSNEIKSMLRDLIGLT
jgi:hypothetical protein